MTHTTVITLPARGVVILASLMPSIALAQGAGPGDATGSVQLSGPTLDEPFHMPTMTDTTTLDVVVVEPWHVDTIDGTTRQKIIDIHVDDIGIETVIAVTDYPDSPNDDAVLVDGEPARIGRQT